MDNQPRHGSHTERYIFSWRMSRRTHQNQSQETMLIASGPQWVRMQRFTILFHGSAGRKVLRFNNVSWLCVKRRKVPFKYLWSTGIGRRRLVPGQPFSPVEWKPSRRSVWSPYIGEVRIFPQGLCINRYRCGSVRISRHLLVSLSTTWEETWKFSETFENKGEIMFSFFISLSPPPQEFGREMKYVTKPKRLWLYL